MSIKLWCIYIGNHVDYEIKIVKQTLILIQPREREKAMMCGTADECISGLSQVANKDLDFVFSVCISAVSCCSIYRWQLPKVSFLIGISSVLTKLLEANVSKRILLFFFMTKMLIWNKTPENEWWKMMSLLSSLPFFCFATTVVHHRLGEVISFLFEDYKAFTS